MKNRGQNRAPSGSFRGVTHTDVLELARRADFAGQTDLATFLYKTAGRIASDGTVLDKHDRESVGDVIAYGDRTMLFDFLAP